MNTSIATTVTVDIHTLLHMSNLKFYGKFQPACKILAPQHPAEEACKILNIMLILC